MDDWRCNGHIHTRAGDVGIAPTENRQYTANRAAARQCTATRRCLSCIHAVIQSTYYDAWETNSETLEQNMLVGAEQ